MLLMLRLDCDRPGAHVDRIQVCDVDREFDRARDYADSSRDGRASGGAGVKRRSVGARSRGPCRRGAAPEHVEPGVLVRVDVDRVACSEASGRGGCRLNLGVTWIVYDPLRTWPGKWIANWVYPAVAGSAAPSGATVSGT